MFSNLTLLLWRVSWIGFLLLTSSLIHASNGLSFMSTSPIHDQEKVTVFVDGGIGSGAVLGLSESSQNYSIYGVNLSANVALPQGALASFHISVMDEVLLLGTRFEAYGGNTLLGIWIPYRLGIVTIQGGFGFMSITEVILRGTGFLGNSARNQFYTINFPLVFSAFLQNKRAVGMGLKAEIDITPKYILAMGTLCIRIGNPKN